MAAMTATITAPIQWAQREDSLYVTISLPDIKDETITITDDKLQFTGTSDGAAFSGELELFAKCVATTSSFKVMPRSVQCVLFKEKVEGQEGEDCFWPRLLKDKAQEKNQVKVDWDKWVDADEEEEAEAFDQSGMGGMGGGDPSMGGMGGPGGMDMASMMAGMGGMGGMPGMGGGMGGMEEMMSKMKSDLESGKGPKPGEDGIPDFGAGGEEGDSDDDDLPDLEES